MRIKIPHSKIYGQPEIKILNNNKFDSVSVNYSYNKQNEIVASTLSFDGFSLKDNISSPTFNIDDYDDNRNESPDYVDNLYEKSFASEDKYMLSDNKSYIEVKWLFLHKVVQKQHGSSSIPKAKFSIIYYSNYKDGNAENSVTANNNKDFEVQFTECLNNDYNNLFPDTDNGLGFNNFYKYDTKFFPSYKWYWNQVLLDGYLLPFNNTQNFCWNEGNDLHLLCVVPCAVKYYLPTNNNYYATIVWYMQSGSINITFDSIQSSEAVYAINGDGNNITIDSRMIDNNDSAQMLANNIVEYWNKGKRTISFKCLYSDYYDYDTNSVAVSGNISNIQNKDKTFNKPTITVTKIPKKIQTNNINLQADSNVSIYRGTNVIYNAKVSLFNNTMNLLFPFYIEAKESISYTFKYNDIDYILTGTLSNTEILGNTLTFSISSTNKEVLECEVSTINTFADLYSYTISLTNPTMTNITFSIKFQNSDITTRATIESGQKSVTLPNNLPYSNITIIDCFPSSDSKYYYLQDLEYKGYELDGLTNGFFTNGDIIVPMLNDTTPILQNNDGSPVEFLVTNCKYNYVSFPYQNISAVEYIDFSKRVLTISQDTKCNTIVKRTFSKNRNGYLGELHDNDLIYIGDTLQIYSSCENGYFLSVFVNDNELTTDSVSTFETEIIVTDNISILTTAQNLPYFKLIKQNNSIGTISRILSPIGNAELGPLSNNAILYENDVIQISTDLDVGEYEIINGTTTDSSSTLIYGGIDKTITVQGNVSVYIRQASYRWKELSGDFGSNIWTGLEFNIGSSYSTNVLVNGAKPRTDKSKDDYKKTYEIKLKYKNENGEHRIPDVIPEQSLILNGVDYIDDISFAGSGILLSLDLTGNDYLINIGGFSVNVSLDCENENHIKITANSDSSSYYQSCYFTEIQILSISQYEYS